MRHGDPRKAQESLRALDGLDVWVNARFGPNLPRLLRRILCVVVRVETVRAAVELVRSNLDAVAEECAKGEERKHLVLKPS